MGREDNFLSTQQAILTIGNFSRNSLVAITIFLQKSSVPMRLKFLTGLILLSVSIHAQEKRKYKLSAAIEQYLATDTMPWKNTMASYDYSYSGHYQQALAYADSMFGFRKNAPRLKEEDSAYVASFKPIPALPYILEKSAKSQITIINEAHNQPLHRAFVTGLLKDLYKQGYRYLGIETLGYGDSLLHQRKYAVDTTGYYSFEPQFGNMIREALQLGFTIFPYETQVPGHNNKEREIDQASNIVNFMKQHKEGKYLLYVGYSHVIEGPVRGWEKAMAGRLKEYTGIDPFTINQEILTEHSSPIYERPEFSVIQANFPAVLINSNRRVYTGLTRDTTVDVMVYHPRTKYQNGRPQWLWQNLPRKAYFLPAKKVTIKYPLLVQAYRKNENDAAIAYDVMELKNMQEKKALALEPGEYRLVLENENEKQILHVRIR